VIVSPYTENKSYSNMVPIKHRWWWVWSVGFKIEKGT